MLEACELLHQQYRLPSFASVKRADINAGHHASHSLRVFSDENLAVPLFEVKGFNDIVVMRCVLQLSRLDPYRGICRVSDAIQTLAHARLLGI